MWPRPGRLASSRRVLATDGLLAAEQHRGIQVALQAQLRPSPAERAEVRSPVDAERLAGEIGVVVDQLGRGVEEQDARHAGIAQPIQQAFEVWPHPPLPLGAGEQAGPGIEHLDRVGPGPVLRDQVAGAQAAEPVEQGVEGGRLLVGERPHPGEVAHAVAFDEVGREGQRRAGEAEQRRAAVELPADDPLRGP